MSNQPEPSTPDSPPPVRRRTIGSTRMQRYAAVFLLVTLLGVYRCVTDVAKAREAARRTTCKGHLKYIALALHNYHEVNGAFPPAYTVDGNGNPLHSWRTLLLPYLDQNPLYKTIDLSRPWNDPVNRKAYETEISAYSCPSLTSRAPGMTTFQAIVGPDACLKSVESRTIAEILDGLRYTAMVVDVNAENAVHWMSPVDHGKDFLLTFGPGSKLQHDRGTNTLFADGMIRFLPTTMSSGTRESIIEINNGDTICDQF